MTKIQFLFLGTFNCWIYLKISPSMHNCLLFRFVKSKWSKSCLKLALNAVLCWQIGREKKSIGFNKTCTTFFTSFVKAWKFYDIILNIQAFIRCIEMISSMHRSRENVKNFLLFFIWNTRYRQRTARTKFGRSQIYR